MLEFQGTGQNAYLVISNGKTIGRVEPGAQLGVGAEWLTGGPWVAVLYRPDGASEQRLPGGSANSDQAALYLATVYGKVYGLPS